MVCAHIPLLFPYMTLTPSALYTQERFTAAISILAAHPGNIRQQLKSSAMEIMLVPREGLPDFEHIFEDILWIQTQLTRTPTQFEGQGSISATIHGMRNECAQNIVERIPAVEAKLDTYIRAELRKVENNA